MVLGSGKLIPGGVNDDVTLNTCSITGQPYQLVCSRVGLDSSTWLYFQSIDINSLYFSTCYFFTLVKCRPRLFLQLILIFDLFFFGSRTGVVCQVICRVCHERSGPLIRICHSAVIAFQSLVSVPVLLPLSSVAQFSTTHNIHQSQSEEKDCKLKFCINK